MAVNISPNKFYTIASMMQGIDEKRIKSIDLFTSSATKKMESLNRQCAILEKANKDMHQESRVSYRHRSNPFDSFDKQESDFSDFVNQVSDTNFLLVAYRCSYTLQQCLFQMMSIAHGIKPKTLLLSNKNFNSLKEKSTEDIQHMMYEFSLNEPAINQFIRNLAALENLQKLVNRSADTIFLNLDNYYKKLLNRHTTEGIKIYRDPILTDIAIYVYKNVDAHGELAGGKDPNEVSAYTLRKAEILTAALEEPSVNEYINDISGFIGFLVSNLRLMKETADDFRSLFANELRIYKGSIEEKNSLDSLFSYTDALKQKPDSSFENSITLIEDVNPKNISYVESNKLLTDEEKFNASFRDETLSTIVDMLHNKKKSKELVQFILKRKSKLKKYFQDENSFYVTKIDSGNSFTGKSPGAMIIIPGAKPNATLDNIVGSGFDEVKGFLKSIDQASEWEELFLATSPSRALDRNNVLLIGPQGCGKCVTGDTLIFTSDGIKQIGLMDVPLKYMTLENTAYQAYYRIKVLSKNGMSESSHFHYDGVRNTFNLKTRHGYTISGTDKHQIITSSINGDAWSRLDSIKIGDYVGIIREGIPFGKESIPLDEAYLLGYFVGDGNISQNKGTPRGITFTIGSDDFKNHFEKYIPSIKKYFGYPKIYKYGDKPYSVRVHDTSLGQHIADQCGIGADNKTVPQIVLLGNRDVWKAFIQGLFDADGSCYNSRIEYSTNSERLANTIHLMLTAFGIISSLKKKDNSKSWRLHIYGDNARKFLNEIGFRLDRKNKSVEFITDNPNTNWDIVPLDKNLWKRLKKDAGKLPRSVHKMIDPYWRGSMPSRFKLKNILKEMFGDEIPVYIESLISNKYMWDKVIEIKDGGEQAVYDLVIPNDESFAANGFMNHNTQIFRAIGSDPKSISISVQGSDFNTCWKGEMEKNPKRLFEGALGLHRDANKRVHILIDEIDSVLNNDREVGTTNLSLEFQILMDGVVNYPGISVWGATNNPGRIPMPMLRRFAKVAIVGELSSENRVTLLKHFSGFMPVDILSNDEWNNLSNRLEGATGDIIRKVIDHIWRSKMTWFVSAKKSEAKEMLSLLKKSEKGFDIKKFGSKDRFNFNTRLGKYVRISYEDINNSISDHLANIAIRSEIETAKSTYKDAKNLIRELNSSKV